MAEVVAGGETSEELHPDYDQEFVQDVIDALKMDGVDLDLGHRFVWDGFGLHGLHIESTKAPMDSDVHVRVALGWGKAKLGRMIQFPAGLESQHPGQATDDQNKDLSKLVKALHRLHIPILNTYIEPIKLLKLLKGKRDIRAQLGTGLSDYARDHGADQGKPPRYTYLAELSDDIVVELESEHDEIGAVGTHEYVGLEILDMSGKQPRLMTVNPKQGIKHGVISEELEGRTVIGIRDSAYIESVKTKIATIVNPNLDVTDV